MKGYILAFTIYLFCLLTFCQTIDDQDIIQKCFNEMQPVGKTMAEFVLQYVHPCVLRNTQSQEIEYSEEFMIAFSEEYVGNMVSLLVDLIKRQCIPAYTLGSNPNQNIKFFDTLTAVSFIKCQAEELQLKEIDMEDLNLILWMIIRNAGDKIRKIWRKEISELVGSQNIEKVKKFRGEFINSFRRIPPTKPYLNEIKQEVQDYLDYLIHQATTKLNEATDRLHRVLSDINYLIKSEEDWPSATNDAAIEKKRDFFKRKAKTENPMISDNYIDAFAKYNINLRHKRPKTEVEKLMRKNKVSKVSDDANTFKTIYNLEYEKYFKRSDGFRLLDSYRVKNEVVLDHFAVGMKKRIDLLRPTVSPVEYNALVSRVDRWKVEAVDKLKKYGYNYEELKNRLNPESTELMNLNTEN